ncbi:MAG: hypothetical protein SPI86_08885 [Treponemataceae bacterium]|nr:hypothetical protein [Treponemataceae bacterium]
MIKFKSLKSRKAGGKMNILSAEQIVLATGLSIEEVKQLQTEKK